MCDITSLQVQCGECSAEAYMAMPPTSLPPIVRAVGRRVLWCAIADFIMCLSWTQPCDLIGGGFFVFVSRD